MRVEIVLALPQRQESREIDIDEGASVSDVIRISKLAQAFPEQDLAAMQAGVWGRPVERDQLVRDGDRVELYRPLLVDPKEARRLKVGR